MSIGLPLMIFAAGFGTRMGPLTKDRPKPMLELAGKTLIERAVDIGRDAGCAPIVANTHYKADLLAPVLVRLGIAISHEADEILDTGGGLRAALPLLGKGRVMTLNPDVAWVGPNPLSALAEAVLPEDPAALLLLVPRDRARGYRGSGDFDLGPDGRVSRGTGYVYTGAQIIAAETLDGIDDSVFSLNRVWTALAERRRLYGAVYEGTWCDAGTPEGLTEAAALLGRTDA